MDFHPEEGLRVMTRARLLSKTKALSTSRSIVLSHLGEAVIKNSSTVNVVHRQNLRRLELETSWRLREIDKSKKQFEARRDRRAVPILVVDRPLSSTITACLLPPTSESQQTPSNSKAGESRTSRQHVHSACPSYMRPTLRTANVLPTIPTIDAYRITNTRRTSSNHSTVVTSGVGTSRPATTSSYGIRFRSAVMPSWPLSDAEQSELRTQWEEHWQYVFNHRGRSVRSRRAAVVTAAAAAAGAADDNNNVITESDVEEILTVKNAPSIIDVTDNTSESTAGPSDGENKIHFDASSASPDAKINSESDIKGNLFPPDARIDAMRHLTPPADSAVTPSDCYRKDDLSDADKREIFLTESIELSVKECCR